ELVGGLRAEGERAGREREHARAFQRSGHATRCYLARDAARDRGSVRVRLRQKEGGVARVARKNLDGPLHFGGARVCVAAAERQFARGARERREICGAAGAGGGGGVA